MPLLRLPPELLEEICSHLDEHDVVNFRRACKMCAEIGLRFALAELKIFCHQSDFGNLRAIANDPTKAKLVRSLVYVPFVMSSLSERKFRLKYKRLLRYRGWQDKDMPSDTEIQRMHTRHENAVHHGRGIIDKKLEAACFAEVLPRLCGLTSLSLRNGLYISEQSHGDEHRPAIRTWSIRKSPYVGYNCGLRERSQVKYPGSGYRGLRALMAGLTQSASSSAPLKLRSLRMGPVEWSSMLFDLPPSSMFSNLVEISFDFEITPQSGSEPWELDSQTLAKHDRAAEARRRKYTAALRSGRLHDFLAGLPNLQLLAIRSFSTALYVLGLHWRLKDIIKPSHRWPYLRRLALSGFVATSQEFLDVVALHKDTLRYIEFGVVELLDNKPKAFVQNVNQLMGRSFESVVWGPVRGPILSDDCEVLRSDRLTVSNNGQEEVVYNGFGSQNLE